MLCTHLPESSQTASPRCPRTGQRRWGHPLGPTGSTWPWHTHSRPVLSPSSPLSGRTHSVEASRNGLYRVTLLNPSSTLAPARHRAQSSLRLRVRATAVLLYRPPSWPLAGTSQDARCTRHTGTPSPRVLSAPPPHALASPARQSRGVLGPHSGLPPTFPFCPASWGATQICLLSLIHI